MVPPPIRIDELLGSLDSAGCPPILLILDDLHEIAGSPAEVAFGRFLEFRPRPIRVIAGSRRPPTINISRLRVSGELREFGADDLRFRSWEVEDLFVGIFGQPLSPESAAALTRRTGGWAAALQLFHLATHGRSATERAKAVADLDGRSRLIRSYLTHNVVAELAPATRDFLVRTCTLGTLTGDLCDALLDRTGSETMLDELAERQLFTSSDDDGRTYRYHEVLRAHLELMLVDLLGSAGARRWYERSAVLLETAGERAAAVRAFARAENWSAVARLIGREGVSGDPDFVLPPGMWSSDPWLARAEGRRLVRAGALTAAALAFREAETLLDDPDFTERCRLDRTLIQLWIPGGRPADAVPTAGPQPVAVRHWSVRIRDSLRRLAEPGVAPQDRPPHHRFEAAVTALLGGHLDRSDDAFRGLAEDPGADAALKLLARLPAAVLQLCRGADVRAELAALAADADAGGVVWVARQARGLHEAVLAGSGGPDWRLVACRSLAAEAAAAGDLWGAALLRLAAGVAGHFVSCADADADLAEAAGRFTALDAAVPALWARALQQLHQALTDSGTFTAGAAHRVADHAWMLGVPGAQAIALSAVAVAGGLGAADAGRLADSIASSTGITGLLRGFLTASAAAVLALAEPAGIHRQRPDDTECLIQINCLGGFVLTVQGRRVDLAALRPRSRALLRLLALSAGSDIHRETLIASLWPDADLTTGTRRLQVAVSSIRQALESAGLTGSELVRRHGDAYRLALPPGCRTDVAQFEELLRTAETADRRGDPEAAIDAWESALALYQADVLPEDGPAEGVVQIRERLRWAATNAAIALSRRLAERGLEPRAIRAAQRATELDDQDEKAWRQLGSLYESMGEPEAARLAGERLAGASARLV